MVNNQKKQSIEFPEQDLLALGVNELDKWQNILCALPLTKLVQLAEHLAKLRLKPNLWA